MLALFYQYLIRHQKIVLPGLGTVALDRQPAVSDFVDHEFLPPSYTFQWTQANANPPDNFFSWMAHRLEIAEEDAVIRINNFIADVKREINAGKEILWSGVGVIRRGLDSSIELEPEQKVLTFDKKVYGDKVVKFEFIAEGSSPRQAHQASRSRCSEDLSRCSGDLSRRSRGRA